MIRLGLVNIWHIFVAAEKHVFPVWEESGSGGREMEWKVEMMDMGPSKCHEVANDRKVEKKKKKR